MMPAGTRYGDLALVWRLMAEARPHWGHLAGLMALSLLATPVALLAPLPLKIAVDNVIGTEPLPAFLRPLVPDSIVTSPPAMLLLIAGLVVVIGLLTYLQALGVWFVATYVGQKLTLGFRTRLFSHLQRLSLAHHDRAGAADSVYRLQYDAGAVEYVAVNGLMPFATSAFTLAAMIYVIALLDWQLALIALSVCPILLLLTEASRGRLRRGWSVVKELESAAMSVAQEVLGAMRVVRAFGREDHEDARFRERSGRVVHGQVRMALLAGGFDLGIGITTALGTAAVLAIGVLHVRRGLISLGDLLVIMAYLAQLYRPLETISHKVAELQSSLASAERVFTVLDQPPVLADRPGARPLARAKGEVACHDVCFAYDEIHPVIRDVSFQVPPGSRVGIFGRTGAGKTTLISLLMRFYDPTSGHVLLDGIDLREYRLADLRNQFAVVLQEPVLFSTSIAENITYARGGASETEIVAAAKAANAHEFILGLPDGYRTGVGERGVMLSGGERQRISLARAFLRNAPILVLDEPTSSVDMATEAGILEAMDRLMRDRTTFIIMHRLHALRGCDRLLHIENGRLADEPAELPLVS